MIGVYLDPPGLRGARRLFDLFKIGWEVARPYKQYEALIADRPAPRSIERRCEIQVFRSPDRSSARFDDAVGFRRGDVHGVSCAGPAALFSEAVDGWTADPAKTAWLGFDLFYAVDGFLGGQVPLDAGKQPLVDEYQDLLRALFRELEVRHVEIRATPRGYQYTAALSHDIDHPYWRAHGLDKTSLGLFKRAVHHVLKGRKEVRRRRSRTVLDVWNSVRFLCAWLRIGNDPWLACFDRYKEFEESRRSTWFVIPEKGQPGVSAEGDAAPKSRGAKYRLAEVRRELRKLALRGDEIGLHGIDAWAGALSASRERETVEQAIGVPCNGVRMHWLYWGPESSRVLNECGFAYDSTVGFNETFGYRSGTCLPHGLGDERSDTIEVPLLAMDTSAFYPSYEGWTLEEALEAFDRIRAHTRHQSGVLTINWHDRSVGFERQWEEAYQELIQRLSEDSVWWATLSEVAAFSKARRRARLDVVGDYPRDYEWTVRSSDDVWSERFDLRQVG